MVDYKNRCYIDDADYNEQRKDLDRKIVILENMTFEWKIPNF